MEIKNKTIKDLIHTSKLNFDKAYEYDLVKANLEKYGIKENLGILTGIEAKKFLKSCKESIPEEIMERKIGVLIYEGVDELKYALIDKSSNIVMKGKYEEKVDEKVNKKELIIVDDFKAYILLKEKNKGNENIKIADAINDKELIRYTAPIRDLFPRLLQKVGVLRHY